MIKVWLTHRLFRHGITSRMVTLLDSNTVQWPSHVTPVPGTPRFQHTVKGEGIDWHRTLEGAKARAEAVRAEKIAELSKEIDRLHGLKLEVNDPE